MSTLPPANKCGHVPVARSLAFSLVLVTGALLTSCDPAFRFAGRVTTVSGQPLVGAEAWIRCGEGGKSFHAVTDQEGRFRSDGLGWRPKTCVVVARADGYDELSVPMMSVCTSKPWHLDDACLEIDADPLRLREEKTRSR
jgi:hypothetical protein